MKKIFTLLVLITLCSTTIFAQFNCATATELTCGLSITDNNITSGTNTISEGYCGTSHNNYSGKERIYSFTISGETTTAKILLGNLTADLDMFLLRSCSPADCIAKSDKSSNYNFEYISVALEPGTYYVVIDGWAGAASSYYLQLQCVANSGELECVDAEEITCGQTISSNTNTGENNTDGLYCNAHGNYSGKEKVYELNLTSTREVTILASGLQADLDMFLLNACDRKTCVALSGKGGSNSEIIKKTLPAGDYFIVLDGYQGVSSAFNLSVSCEGVETLDCDNLVTSYYSGNGTNLKFNYRFNAQANLEFVSWNVNNTILSTSPHVQFIFPSAGSYNVCATYRNTTTGETLTCCKTACISAPTYCEDMITYQYVNGVYKLGMDTNMSSVSNVSWRNDTDGVGLDPNNVAASCRTITVSVRYYSNTSNCWIICCRTIAFCPPSSCQNAITNTFSGNTYTFNFSHPNATNLVWKLDETGETMPGGQYTLPSGWTCKNRTATVYYYDTALNTWKACCKKFNLCPPSTCDGTIDYDYVATGNQFRFSLNVAGATNVQWTFVDDGSAIPGGVFSLPNNWTCQDRTVKASYYDPAYQTWRTCTKRFTICPPTTCAESITSDYNEATRTFTFDLNIAGASNFYWRFDEDLIYLPGGKFTLPVGWQCREYTVSVFWKDAGSDTWRVCCKKINICPPMDCGNNMPISSFSFEVNDTVVNFSNTSTNFDSLSYNYDGGTVQADGSVLYQPGTYSVCLSVFNDCGTDVSCRYFTIMDEVVAGEELVFKVDSLACRGEGTEVIIPVTTRNFTDILTFNFTIQASDTTNVKILGIEDLNPVLEGGSNSLTESDQVRFFWSSTAAENLDDNALLFRIRVALNSVTTEPVSLSFVDEPVATEAFNGSLEQVDLLTEDGSLCVIPLPAFATLGGKIMTPEGLSPVSKVNVSAMGTEPLSVTTSNDGNFMLEGLNFGDSYLLSPSKNSDPYNGLNALDIVTLQRHILQISMLESPYRMIAADVNNDKVINAIDVVLMQRMQLRIIDEFPDNTSWKFIPTSYQFTTDNPLTEEYPTELAYSSLDGDFMDEDFYGVKMGDLNNSVNPAKSGPGDTLELTMDRIFANGPGIVEVDVRANGFFELAVFEGTMKWDTEKLDFVDVTNFGVDNLGSQSFGQPNGTNGILTFTWSEPSVSGKSVPDSTVIFTLRFDVIGEGGTEAFVEFADEPLDVSASDKLLEPVTVVENDGQVAILSALALSANVQDVTCKFGSDGFIALDVSGGTENFEYEWSNGAMTDSIGGLEEGTYGFTVTDVFSGLQLIESISLISPDQLEVAVNDVSIGSDTLGSISAEVVGGVPPYAYSWSNDSTGTELVSVENGFYELTVTDANGCEIRGSIDLDHMMSSSIPTVEVMEWTIFPNPTIGKVTVEVSATAELEDDTWSLFNVLGERLASGSAKVSSGSFTVDLSSMTPGLYYLHVGDSSAPILLIK